MTILSAATLLASQALDIPYATARNINRPRHPYPTGTHQGRVDHSKFFYDEQALRFYANIRNWTTPLPNATNWFDNACAINDVKNEGPFETDKYHAITALLASHMCRRTGEITPLSTQELIDCAWSKSETNDVRSELEYVIRQGGLSDSDEYDYRGYPGFCAESQYDLVEVPVKGWVKLEPEDELELQLFVARYGPVMVKVDSTKLFGFDSEPVYPSQAPSECDYDKYALVVGYDTDPVSGGLYWLVKTSFGYGPDSSDGGYVYVGGGSYEPCNLAHDAMIATF